MHLPIALDPLRIRHAGTAAAIALLVGACGPSTSPPPPTSTTAAIATPVDACPHRARSRRHATSRAGPPAPPLTAAARRERRPVPGRPAHRRPRQRPAPGRVVNAARRCGGFPTTGSLPRGQGFAADDAFLAPDGKSIVANDEGHHVIDRIDIATRKIVWQYGHYGTPGRGVGYLNTPDDAYPLANGDVVVADIRNCRVIEIAPSKQIVRQWGTTGRCVASAPECVRVAERRHAAARRRSPHHRDPRLARRAPVGDRQGDLRHPRSRWPTRRTRTSMPRAT